jgi:hypothetical protein
MSSPRRILEPGVPAAFRGTIPRTMRPHLVLLVALALSCSKSEPSAQAPEPAATPAGPTEDECVNGRNPHCAAGKALSGLFAFSGTFADAKCTEPIALRLAAACVPVVTTGLVSVSLNDSLGTHKPGEALQGQLRRQLGPDEAKHMFTKEGGACKPLPPTTEKVTPLGCEGKRVCRNAANELSCDSCRVVPITQGCPDWEGSRTFITFDTK